MDSGGAYFDFQWVDCCVDGAAMGPLDSAFCVELSVGDSEGLGGGWSVYNGAAAVVLGDVSDVLTICETQ